MPVELVPGVYWVGAIDWNIRDFHGYLTDAGSTYNAYLIVDDKITLIHTVKEGFISEMMGVETQRRAITEAGSQLGETLAQLSAADLARERGFQETATSGAMGLLPGIASGYQGLGSILGQAGTAAGNLSLNQAGALGTLGGTLAAREYAGVTSPIDYLLNYLATARGTAVQTPSAFGQLMGALGSGLGGAGQAMGGAAALMAASDRRVKILHGSGEEKLRKFLSELSAYQYTYVPSMGLGSDKHIGVMAQDMEKSEVGRAFVKTREDGVKFIDYGLALNTMMAAVAMLNRKVEELEARDAGKS